MKQWQVKFLGAAWAWWLVLLMPVADWLGNAGMLPLGLRDADQLLVLLSIAGFFVALMLASALMLAVDEGLLKNVARGFFLGLASMFGAGVAALVALMAGHSVGLF